MYCIIIFKNIFIQYIARQMITKKYVLYQYQSMLVYLVIVLETSLCNIK